MTKAELAAAIAALEELISKLDTWVLAFAALVAIGVVGEAILGVWHWRLDGKMRDLRHSESQLHERELAQLEKETQEAAARAAEANRKAEEEKLARVKIEQRLADRVLTDAQLATIADKVRPFSGQEYQVTTFWELREPLAISNRIHQALTLAGWTYIPHGQGGAFLLGGLSGVQVWIHPDADVQVKNAANSLVSALNDEDIAAVLKQQNPQNPKDNKIALNVGTKP